MGITRYLRGLFDKGDIRLDAERPDNVQLIFVQLQQEYDQNEQRIEHKKRKHALVPQLDQVTGNASLSWIREEKKKHIVRKYVEKNYAPSSRRS